MQLNRKRKIISEIEAEKEIITVHAEHRMPDIEPIYMSETNSNHVKEIDDI